MYMLLITKNIEIVVKKNSLRHCNHSFNSIQCKRNKTQFYIHSHEINWFCHPQKKPTKSSRLISSVSITSCGKIISSFFFILTAHEILFHISALSSFGSFRFIEKALPLRDKARMTRYDVSNNTY